MTGADQVSRDDPCPIPALTAVGGLGGTAVADVDGVCAWGPATTAATTGGAAGVAAGVARAAGAAAGATGVLTPGSDGVRVGVVVDGAGLVVGVVAGVVVPVPVPDCLRRSPGAPPARIRLAPAPDAGATVPAAAGDVDEPVAGAPVVGLPVMPPEDGVGDGSEVDGDAASAEDGIGVVPWTATTLAAEEVGAGLPCTARATPTTVATRTTTVAPRTLRACTPGNGPSPTSHRSHCLKA